MSKQMLHNSFNSRKNYELQQNDRLVGDYYCKLKTLWDQIFNLEGIPVCSCGVMKSCKCNVLKKLMEMEATNKLLKFRMGLNNGYNHMKTNFLSMDPLLPVNKAYNLVLQVERQKEILGEIKMGNEVSAMVAFGQEKSLGLLNYFNKKEYKEKRMKKALKKCDHRGKRGHVKDECFKIKEAPEWYENLHKKKYKQASNVTREQGSSEENTPFDGLGKEEGSGSIVDNAVISIVVQEVMKAMGEKQSFSNLQVKFQLQMIRMHGL